MKIGIYDPYLDTLSGGEKYMLTAASCLSGANNVRIFWDDPSILEIARGKLGIDLSKTQIAPNIFSRVYPASRRLPETLSYDLLFILSDGSIPLTLSANTILHFQFPVEWVNGLDIKTKIKLQKISKIICNSVFTKKFIDKKFHVNSLVIYPPCVSIAQIEKNSNQKSLYDKKNIILSVGRYSPLPGGSSIKKQEAMIQIFKKMIDNGLKNWELFLAVSFLKEHQKNIIELEQSIKNYPIKIIKNCSYDELENFYSQAKIYWHAAGFGENLTQHPERAEHFGITTVEAMAHGVVPVVISAGGQPEIVDDNINGFLWVNEEEMIQKTRKIIIDTRLRDQMAVLALKKLYKFSIENFCEQIQKIAI